MGRYIVQRDELSHDRKWKSVCNNSGTKKGGKSPSGDEIL